MSSKTAAELQLEFLKKLKEQQKTAPLRPRPSSAAPLSQDKKPMTLRESKTMRPAALRRIPLSESAWKKLKHEGIEKGHLKLNKNLGDWAVELLLNFPIQMQKLSTESKYEIFLKIKEWSAERGMK